MLASVTEKNTMLYCPKCQTKYEEGTQRFCVIDKTRLLALPSAVNAAKKSNGVFSSILSTTLDFDNETVASNVKPQNFEQLKEQIQQRTPEPPKSEIPQTHSNAVKKEQETVRQEEKSKPAPRFIKPSEIPSGTAEVGDRQSNPIGRLAVTAENPNVLLGHTIKGRYSVIGRLRQDANSILFLTKDKLSNDKKAFVRVLLGEEENDDLTNKMFAEERVSISHINHPNILRVIDSGELPEGKPFIVSTYVEGKTLADILLRREQFNALRAARIVNQAASALSEVHQNDILHRRLTPEDIILTVSEDGTEQVKLTNFGIFEEEIPEQNLPYTAPENIQGNSYEIAGDIYSLAVIAYQMLTGRLPYNGNSAREMLNAQREKLKLFPSNVRLDISPTVDQILEKAMSPDSNQRYPKARDFGDAFYNAISATATENKKDKTQTKKSSMFAESFELDEIETNYFKEPKVKKEEIANDIPDLILPENQVTAEEQLLVEAPEQPEILKQNFDTLTEPEQDYFELEPEEIVETETAFADDPRVFSPILMPKKPLEMSKPKKEIISPVENVRESESELSPIVENLEETNQPKIEQEISVEEPNWKKRSIDGKSENTWKAATLALFGVVILIGAGAGIYYYFNNRPTQPAIVVNQNPEPPAQSVVPTPGTPDIETPPIPRSIEAPPDSLFFENSRENLNKEMLKDYRGFQLYYPKDWKRNYSDNKFIDISRENEKGLPIEQFMVSSYESNGTFQKDQDKFPELVKRSNEDLKKFLPNYEVVSSDKTNINDGWQAYEVKFKNVGEVNGKPFTLWGRRLWVPAARPGVKSGLVITMFATSLSETVKGVDDVGMTGGLGVILSTFEPDQNM